MGSIGIAKEIAAKGLERRAILLPGEVGKLIEGGYRVFVEKGLGERIYITDDKYKKAGAKIVSTRKNIYNKLLILILKKILKTWLK